MSNLESKQANRFKFLNKLYELSEGNERFNVNYLELGDDLGFDRSETITIAQYLRGEGLIRDLGSRAISITHSGIVEIEEVLKNRDKPTDHFPSYKNIIIIENMTNSQIQQESTNSEQTATFSKNNLKDLAKIINQLNENIENLNLPLEELKEAKVEIATLEAQSKSNRPKKLIISESLSTLRKIIEGATGSIIATELLKQLSNLQF